MGAQSSSSHARVDPVDALVIAVLERMTAGDAGALDELCAANPALAPTIRARVAELSEMNLLPSDAAAMAFPERLGDFRLVRRLGGGGMGVVYEAVQESLGRGVALKLIRPEHLYFERSRERFQRETEAVARLAHPGIVSIYTVGEAHGTPYFAMELIQGGTLAQALEQVVGLAPESLVGTDLRAAVLALASADAGAASERVPELFEGTWAETCTRVILRMSEALAHAHGRGVLHRDIKPSNIAVTPEGRVALLDFGLAGLEHELRLTATGSALGSVLYMAPEQIAGRSHEIDARTDVYALGVTLYELLTLQTPFAGADSEQTRAAILDGQPQPIRARYRGVPRDLEIVCLTAMDRDRARRYASMEAFGEDLRNVLEHRAIHARPPSAAYRIRRWMWRHPTTTTAVVLGTLLVTVLPTALYLQQRASRIALERALEEATQARTAAAAEKERASDKADQAEHAARFLVELFAASDPYSVGPREVTARELLDTHVERAEQELAGQPELLALLLERMGESYTNRDQYAQALAPLGRALELRKELHGDDDLHTLSTQVLYASALRLAGRPGVVELLRPAHEALAKDPDADIAAVINAGTLLAAALLDAGEFDESLDVLTRTRERLPPADAEQLDLHWLVLTMHSTVYNRMGDWSAAEASAREALELEPLPDQRSIPWRAAALDTLANSLRSQGRLDEAAAVYAELLPLAREFYADDNVVLAQMELGDAFVRRARGESQGLPQIVEHAFAVLRRGLGVENSKTLGALEQLTSLWIRAGRFDDCAELLRDVLAEMTSRFDESDPRCAAVLQMLGTQALATGDWEAAAQSLQRALELAGEARAESVAALRAALALAQLEDPAHRDEAATWARDNLASPLREVSEVARYVSARVALEDGRSEDAQAVLRAGPTNAPSPSAMVLASNALLGEILIGHGDVDAGCAMLTQALTGLAETLAPEHALLRDARTHAGRSGATAKCAELAEISDER